MTPEVARYLLFSAAAAAADGAAAAHGPPTTSAQQRALQLACALQAEEGQLPTAPNLLSALQADCARLLVLADATPAALEARAARRAAAAGVLGDARGQLLQPSHDLGDALLRDVAGGQLLDQAASAQQLLAQAADLLQSKVAQRAAAAAATAAGGGQQHPGTSHHHQAAPERTRRRSITVPTLQPGGSTLDRKRPLDGTAAAAASAAQQADRAAAAAARWGAAGAEAAPAAKRHEPAAAAVAAGAGPSDPIEVDCSSGDDDGRQQRSRQQQQQRPGGGRPGFQTARTQLVSDLRKKGQHQQASLYAAQSAPRAGLTRPRGGGGEAGGGGAGGRPGFVPPFVAKAIEHHTGGGGQQGGGAAAAAGGGGEEEGPLSARTLEMLGVPPGGELPPELAKQDPKLIEAVCNEVIDGSGGVSWDDIAGLHTAKDLIKEIVVWPMLNPHLFTGPRAPPKGILLFGPPGTGKTLIGKAVASNIRASFFSISASSLTSKWIGEGEKMVKALFAVAGVMQPSVIFIDEIDSLMSARKADGEHESSRRLKTELLVQMEGCDPASTERRVLLVGATNRPEELDEAARRRLPKQLYIPLPCAEARRAMILRQLGPGAKVAASLSEEDLSKVVSRTAGYSGSDVRNLIQEACQGPVRAAVAEHGEAVASLRDADLRPVVLRDFQHAARAQRASVTAEEIVRYEAYNARHGAQYVGVAGRGGGSGGGEAGEEEEDW